MYGSILVATDGSERATRAARQAATLARTFEATIHVVSVVDARTYSSGMADADDVGSEQERKRVEEAERDTEALAEELRADLGDDRVLTAVARGVPHEALVEYAVDEGVDLVAMGTQGRTGLKRLVIGSVTERVVRTSAVPVLSVRASARAPVESFDDVVVPTDGSDTATAAAEHAIAVGRRYDATVHAVHVANVTSVPGYHDGVVEDLSEQLRAEGTRAVDAVAEMATEAGLDAVTEMRSGTPANRILAYAEDVGADLVTMGTQGRTGLQRYLLGSVTERVVRSADAPVLSVRGADASE